MRGVVWSGEFGEWTVKNCSEGTGKVDPECCIYFLVFIIQVRQDGIVTDVSKILKDHSLTDLSVWRVGF